jgi:glycine oxidase
MLAAQIEADATDRLLQFALEARNYYVPLAEELHETTGIDIGLWQEGIGRVATDESDAEGLRTKVAWQRKQGYACEWLDEREIRLRWPWLASSSGALWAPLDGALHPSRLVEALLSDARRLGSTIVADRALRVDEQAGRIVGVTGAAGKYRASNVIVAAGAWSASLLGIPRALPVRPVRGQMAAARWPEDMRRAIVYHHDAYILARGNEAILGSTMEEAGFRSEVTSEGLAAILSATARLCPGLFRAKIRRRWAGLRPMTPDQLPIIGPEPTLDGLWYATGHGRNGILLAGLTGRLIADLIDGSAIPAHLPEMGIERFGS